LHPRPTPRGSWLAAHGLSLDKGRRDAGRGEPERLKTTPRPLLNGKGDPDPPSQIAGITARPGSLLFGLLTAGLDGAQSSHLAAAG
jgi:hypothetical protein